MSKVYLIEVFTGSVAQSQHVVLFGTTDYDYAVSYVKKFNRIINDYKKFYDSFNDSNGYFISSQYMEYADRYWQLQDVGHASVVELKMR